MSSKSEACALWRFPVRTAGCGRISFAPAFVASRIRDHHARLKQYRNIIARAAAASRLPAAGPVDPRCRKADEASAGISQLVVAARLQPAFGDGADQQPPRPGFNFETHYIRGVPCGNLIQQCSCCKPLSAHRVNNVSDSVWFLDGMEASDWRSNRKTATRPAPCGRCRPCHPSRGPVLPGSFPPVSASKGCKHSDGSV